MMLVEKDILLRTPTPHQTPTTKLDRQLHHLAQIALHKRDYKGGHWHPVMLADGVTLHIIKSAHKHL